MTVQLGTKANAIDVEKSLQEKVIEQMVIEIKCIW